MSAGAPVDKEVSALFTPFALDDLRLVNRVVMAPMTRSRSPGGVPPREVAAYYRRRAENDVGLIISEGTVIDHPASANDVNVPRFHGADALAGWQRVLEEVHAAGGRIFPQLWHVGSVRKPADSPNPDAPSISPSGLRKAGVPYGEPMTRAEIAQVVDAFGRAAGDAMRMGFDGVEIHGAHGYLVDQFFWATTNQRDDEYGGDMQRRARLAVEIVQAVRRATSPRFPISLRISQWKAQDYTAKLATTPDELGAFLRPLVAAGVDLFHCSTRRYWEPAFEGSPSNLAGWTKRLTGKPVITVGSVGLDGDMASAFRGKDSSIQPVEPVASLVERGEADLVAVGRALLGDPAWARKIREGRTEELRPFAAASMAVLH